MKTQKENKENSEITHEGVLEFGGITVPCFVLKDGSRIISGRGIQEALRIRDKPEEGEKRGGYILPTFLQSKALKPFVDNNLEVAKLNPRKCYRGSTEYHGFEATALADLCDAILDARNSGAKLTERQQIVAVQCEIIVRSLARVGIIALVDEATGYQHVREKDELQKILKAYIAQELLAWQKTFPDVFYKELFRLNGWDYTVNGIKKRPGVIGTWTNKLIYEQLPPGVLSELKDKTPKSESGNYTARFFQSLTPNTGNPHLTAQIQQIITLFQLSDTMEHMWNQFNKLKKRQMGESELPFYFDDKGHTVEKPPIKKISPPSKKKPTDEDGATLF